jgi:hypothetical protein
MSFKKLMNASAHKGGLWSSVLLDKDELYETTDGVRIRYEGHHKQVTIWMQLPEQRMDVPTSNKLLSRAARSIANSSTSWKDDGGKCHCGHETEMYQAKGESFMACGTRRCAYMKWL